MKIAIISDSHDNLVSLRQTLSLIEKERIGTLIHCGDVSSVSTLEKILYNFSGPFYLALGNADGDLSNSDFKEFSEAKIWQEFGEISADQKKIAFSHSPEIAKNLARSQKYDFVFHGHTHKPWEEKIGKTKLVNPGNIAGLYFRPTFAILDIKTEKLRLKLLTD